MATAKRRGGSYIIEASCGYDRNGRRLRQYMTWKPAPGMTQKQIEKELERQKFRFDEKCSAGYYEGRVTFEEFAEVWFKEYAEKRYKIRTLERCQQLRERVYAAIGHLSMDKITTRTVQKFIMNLTEPGIKQVRTKDGDSAPQSLSVKSLKHYLSFISGVFRYAVSQGVVRDNPARGVVLPAAKPVERDCYTLEEAQQFLELLEKEPFNWRLFFTLAIYTGFRRGELYGLEWQGIDFDKSTITVNRTSLHTAKAGTDIRTVSAVLGHSQTSTTLNIYAHSFAAQQAAASEAVANVLELRKGRAHA